MRVDPGFRVHHVCTKNANVAALFAQLAGIAMSKVWANGLVIAVAVGLSLYLVVRMMLGIPVAGSIPLFMVGVVIYLFFATVIGIFLGTVARSMPQLGLLYMLVYLPMNMLSGGNTPLESMPPWLARLVQVSPSTHFVASHSRFSIAVPGST
jgi:ABC-2 type transport system permease protein